MRSRKNSLLHLTLPLRDAYRFAMMTMHPNQILTSPDLVRNLLRSQYPALADEPVADTPFHGTDNDVYRVGNYHSVRLPIVDWSVNNEERIRPWLPWLGDRLSTRVPVPVYYGRPDSGYPYSWTIYPWIAGETRPFGTDGEQIAKDIAAFLKELRSLPAEGAPSAGRSPHALDVDVRKCLDQLTDADRREELIEIWDAMMQSPVWDGSGAFWMHGDVAPGNLLLVDGRLNAAIDWSGLGVGDPASDLQVAWNFFGSTGREVFREAMDVNDEIWYRARARAFAQAAFQLPYYRDSFPALAEQARYVFAQILAESS